MRLTVDLLKRAEQRTNCLGERELILNGYGIPAIENTASIVSSSSSSNGGGGEEFDTLNICNNLLIRLDNFSRWHRLSNLIASNNRIESIDGNNFIKNVPNLISLTLSFNNVSSLSVIQAIGQSCKLLQFLDLTGNPVTRRSHYRLYTIYSIPTLRCLDCVKVKREERVRATKFAKSATGAALQSDVEQQSASTTVKTFTPGESADGTTVVTLFSSEEKEEIRSLLANAGSIQEVEEIENAVRKGILPDQLVTRRQLPPPPPPPPPQVPPPPPPPKKRSNNETSNGDANGSHDATEPPATRRSKRLKGT